MDNQGFIDHDIVITVYGVVPAFYKIISDAAEELGWGKNDPIDAQFVPTGIESLHQHLYAGTGTRGLTVTDESFRQFWGEVNWLYRVHRPKKIVFTIRKRETRDVPQNPANGTP